MTSSDNLLPGFADPVFDSQRVFRTVLDALSHPGTICNIASDNASPAPLMPATAALCLALLDFESRVWLQPEARDSTADSALHRYLRFHCGCPIAADSRSAHFAIVHDAEALPSLNTFHPGDAVFPDRSTTVIIQVSKLVSDATGQNTVTLRGPGIRDTSSFACAGLPLRFWQEWRENAEQFPLGVDVILVDGKRMVGLPRTVQVETPACM